MDENGQNSTSVVYVFLSVSIKQSSAACVPKQILFRFHGRFFRGVSTAKMVATRLVLNISSPHQVKGGRSFRRFSMHLPNKDLDWPTPSKAKDILRRKGRIHRAFCCCACVCPVQISLIDEIKGQAKSSMSLILPFLASSKHF